ncbi:hypothetical protein CI102_11058 [Trichoderma harzianum]|uniref:Uncharacterized protein n=1 Tax=Trichoderma harzianum CBS 226.95 TaxID=983964 RepID=A0A2T4A8F0_TRIHA|nr:hypothetical protein M431DRAFT_460908 [Trichoderma harzianum CBS 226.95]PKK46382.1 hypothetical protein CI102_11058 [Trichoderma harzianum]PTB53355.1 hypothetical protein M431DRAFT_460908 [Trichoderma harzianum CBS 226.95]
MYSCNAASILLRYLASRGPAGPPYLRLYAMLRSFFMHAETPTQTQRSGNKGKERERKKKDPNRFRGDIKPLPVGGGWMRARNSTSIKHIQLRNNTHTPNKSEKALGRNKQCLEGKRQRRAVSLPHSEILTLPLFPVWSPKSFFVCRTTFLRGMSKRAEKQQASKKAAASRLQPCSYSIPHNG